MLNQTEQAEFMDLYQAGQAQQDAGKKVEARASFEKALALAANGTEKAKAWFAIGLVETDHDLARAAFEKVVITEGAPAELKAQAQMNIGDRWRKEGWTTKSHACEAMWANARTAHAKVLDIPGVAPKLQLEAVRAVAKNLKAFSSETVYTNALAELKRMLERNDLPAEAKACLQVSIGKCHFFREKYTAAGDALAKALGMQGISIFDKVEAQLYIGLGNYAEKDYERATLELQKVLAMPGASPGQTHAATLRLRLRKLIPSDEQTLAILFIGASQTQGWNVPLIVETLAASAPAGRPRIIADQFTRGGTTITKFWEEGAGPLTARARIAEEPWDFVVFETHPFLSDGYDVMFQYAGKFADLIRSRNATPVFFEAPAFFKNPYPAQFQKIHDATIKAAQTLKTTVAPANYAWMKYLGSTPTSAQRMALYIADAVHPSPKGAYLIACSIYTAVTGFSPVGLTHDIPSFTSDGITQAEALACQEAAWQAFQETNAALNPMPPL